MRNSNITTAEPHASVAGCSERVIPNHFALRAQSCACRMDLSDNTNLWGVPPAAAAHHRGAQRRHGHKISGTVRR